MMNQIQIMVAQTALKNMIDKGHFDICAIKSISKATGTYVDKKILDLLTPLHCVDFKDMQPKLRAWVFKAMVECFEDLEFDESLIDNMFNVLKLVEADLLTEDEAREAGLIVIS